MTREATAGETMSGGQFLARVEAGEEIVAAGGKKPVARLLAHRLSATERWFGALKTTVSGRVAFRPRRPSAPSPRPLAFFPGAAHSAALERR